MVAMFGGGRRRSISGVFKLAGLAACTLGLASCASTPPSYQAEAIAASQAGDQRKAVSLAEKEVALYSRPGQCSSESFVNCGTLALAYGSLAEYQILAGDRVAGERSFRLAKEAISRTDLASKRSATGMVYRDVSEAYWKTGDKPRAIAVYKEGRAAGGDGWLSMSAAADAAARELQEIPSGD